MTKMMRRAQAWQLAHIFPIVLENWPHDNHNNSNNDNGQQCRKRLRDAVALINKEMRDVVAVHMTSTIHIRPIPAEAAAAAAAARDNCQNSHMEKFMANIDARYTRVRSITISSPTRTKLQATIEKLARASNVLSRVRFITMTTTVAVREPGKAAEQDAVAGNEQSEFLSVPQNAIEQIRANTSELKKFHVVMSKHSGSPVSSLFMCENLPSPSSRAMTSLRATLSMGEAVATLLTSLYHFEVLHALFANPDVACFVHGVHVAWKAFNSLAASGTLASKACNLRMLYVNTSSSQQLGSAPLPHPALDGVVATHEGIVRPFELHANSIANMEQLFGVADSDVLEQLGDLRRIRHLGFSYAREMSALPRCFQLGCQTGLSQRLRLQLESLSIGLRYSNALHAALAPLGSLHALRCLILHLTGPGASVTDDDDDDEDDVIGDEDDDDGHDDAPPLPPPAAAATTVISGVQRLVLRCATRPSTKLGRAFFSNLVLPELRELRLERLKACADSRSSVMMPDVNSELFFNLGDVARMTSKSPRLHALSVHLQFSPVLMVDHDVICQLAKVDARLLCSRISPRIHLHIPSASRDIVAFCRTVDLLAAKLPRDARIMVSMPLITHSDLAYLTEKLPDTICSLSSIVQSQEYRVLRKCAISRAYDEVLEAQTPEHLIHHPLIVQHSAVLEFVMRNLASLVDLTLARASKDMDEFLRRLGRDHGKRLKAKHVGRLCMWPHT